MTDAVHSPAHVSGTSMRLRLAQAAARLRTAIRRWIVAIGTSRALSALSDAQLRDIGLTRTDIPFVAATTALRQDDAARAPCGCINRSAGSRDGLGDGRLQQAAPSHHTSWLDRLVSARTSYI